MKTSLHRIIAKDGLGLQGILYEPEQKTDTVLAHVHGMGGNFYENKFLDALAETLTDNGIAFCPFNNRGNGFITEFVKSVDDKKDYIRIGNSFEKFEDSLIDIDAHIGFLEEQGYKNIHLSGHSLGAPKVAYFSSQPDRRKLESVIFISPSDMLGLVREEKQRFEEDIKTAQEMISNGKGGEIMQKQVWDSYPISANTYIDLFGDKSLAAIFNFHNKDLGFDVLSKIKIPIFTSMGGKDDVLVIPIEDIMKIIKEETNSSSKVEHEIVGDAGHDYFGYEQDLANAILGWVKEN